MIKLNTSIEEKETSTAIKNMRNTPLYKNIINREYSKLDIEIMLVQTSINMTSRLERLESIL